MITRIALAVLIVLQLVWLIVNLVQCKNCDTQSIIWYAFTIAVLVIGLIGAWKEHFLTAAVFSITEIILVALGFAMFASTGKTAIAVALTLIGSAIYAIMLYMSGKRDMGMPEVC